MVAKLFIKQLNGRTLTIKLRDSDFQSYTVLQVKIKIQDAEGIPVDQQRVIYEGKQLEDRRTLFECGIRHKSVIHMVLRLRGGFQFPEEGAGGMGDKGGNNLSMEELLDF